MRFLVCAQIECVIYAFMQTTLLQMHMIVQHLWVSPPGQFSQSCELVDSAQFEAKADMAHQFLTWFSSFRWPSCEVALTLSETKRIHVSVDLFPAVLHALIMFRG